MFTRAIITAITLLAFTPVFAGGRGGHVTSFDANLFPGVAFKNIKTDYSATCNGTGTNDDTAFASWLSYGISQGATRVGLYIPPGSNCVGCRYVWDLTNGNPGIQNAVIWAYGATCTSISTGVGDGGERLGAGGFYEDSTHSAFVQTASLNDTSVTLVTAGQASRFSVGDWVMLAALELQTFGFPPNFQFYQFSLVTAINGGVISISPPVNSSRYKSTYPSIDRGDGMGADGPAMLFKMQPNWNTNLQILGLTTAISGPLTGTQDTMQGRTVVMTDFVSGSANTSPSVCQTCIMSFSNTSGQEVDKEVIDYTLYRTRIRSNLTFQSPTPNNAIITSSSVSNALNGFPLNGVFNNSSFGDVRIGTTNYGHVNNNTFVNSSVPNTASLAQHLVVPSWLTYNNDGTFSIAKASSNYSNVVAWAVPGFKYAFADGDGTLNSVPTTSFTISDVIDQGSSIKIITDLPNTLPTPTCNAAPCDAYQAYAGGTIIQQFSGPADLTQYAAP